MNNFKAFHEYILGLSKQKLKIKDSSTESEAEDDMDHPTNDDMENHLADDSDHPMSSDNDDASDTDENDADSENETKTAGNDNWAKSFARILKQEKPKNKKNLVLSQAKKLKDVLQEREKAKQIGFEIEGEIKEEKPDRSILDTEIIEKKLKKDKILSLRIKPSMMDQAREKAFKKLATKGVVQLFNAVRTQQKDTSQKLQEAGRLDHKRDAVLNNINKKKFLDVLMGGKRSKSEALDNPIKDEIKEESDYDDEVYNDGLPKTSIWSVLK